MYKIALQLLLPVMLLSLLSAQAQDSPSAGRPLPNVNVKTLTGENFVFNKLENGGKPMVVDFWATWCKPCLAEFPELKAALPRLQSDSVAFFLATEEDLDQIRAFEEKRNFGLEFLHLKEATLADFEVHALPTTLVLDSTGKVVYRHMGQLNWQEITSIEDLISQKP